MRKPGWQEEMSWKYLLTSAVLLLLLHTQAEILMTTETRCPHGKCVILAKRKKVRHSSQHAGRVTSGFSITHRDAC